MLRGLRQWLYRHGVLPDRRQRRALAPPRRYDALAEPSGLGMAEAIIAYDRGHLIVIRRALEDYRQRCPPGERSKCLFLSEALTVALSMQSAGAARRLAESIAPRYRSDNGTAPFDREEMAVILALLDISPAFAAAWQQTVTLREPLHVMPEVCSPLVM